MNRIRNIRELNIEKQKIKNSLTKDLDKPLTNVFSFLSTVRGLKKKRNNTVSKKNVKRNIIIDEGTKAILTLAASATSSRFKLGIIPKIIITAGVSLATPYVVDFIQKKLRS